MGHHRYIERDYHRYIERLSLVFCGLVLATEGTMICVEVYHDLPRIIVKLHEGQTSPDSGFNAQTVQFWNLTVAEAAGR